MNSLLTNKTFRQIVLITVDVAIVAACTWLSVLMRFNMSSVPVWYSDIVIKTLPIDMAITVIVFWIFKLYHSVWSYASLNEIIKTFQAVTVVVVIEIAYKAIIGMSLPRSVYFMIYASMIVLVTASRLSVRVAKHYYSGAISNKAKRVMIVGAGSAGAMLLTEFSRQPNNDSDVICLIDDNQSKHGKYLHGIEIVGNRFDIEKEVENKSIEEIIIAMPAESKNTIAEIVEICNKTDCRVRILPSIVKSLEGNLSSNIRDISYEDLLSRDQIVVNDEGIDEYIGGKVILVTGGGGSIGSELCRQIAKRHPKQLIVLDIYENNAYSIQTELASHSKEVDLKTIVASVRDEARMEDIFRAYKPEIVFHAAAHKHVPLMEFSPNEAIKNNCMGTEICARLADKYGVSKFVLISTDKAVRPTSIMGASKRICEMIVQDWAKKSENTYYAAVRFGNVLGSNGSVIPLFLKQIEDGGPVTVTHKEITRFFMTIPEAVQLVLQAGAFATGGEIFVLDMGKQVKIYDLAISLIKMKGYRPFDDIDIEVIGLRPGEKLYEEVLMDEEGLKRTENQLIHVGKPIDMDFDKFEEELKQLIESAMNNEKDIKQDVAKICDTYTITDNDKESK